MRVINPGRENTLLEVNYWLIPEDMSLGTSIRKRVLKMKDIYAIADEGGFITEGKTEVEKGITIYIDHGFDFIIAAEKYNELLSSWAEWLGGEKK
jgi:hypothetical protein